MISSNILSIVTFIYGLAGFLYLFGWVFHKAIFEKPATLALLAGWLGNTAAILLRWVESYRLGMGHAPLSNLFESLVFFAWSIALMGLFLEWRYRNRTLGLFTTPLAFLALSYASLSPGISDRIQPLIPALKSNWLIAHVITCFIGYASFAVALGVSVMYLIRDREAVAPGSLADRLPGTAFLDELNHRLVLFGLLFLTVGIITGAVWANQAWGRYWGWDPKETWSLITWFVYAALLHFRLMRGWHGKRIAYLAIVGFMAVLFTYFGVNLLPGLHSYGSMSAG
jgi:cytochrome c-type biogenesis protein CcsB